MKRFLTAGVTLLYFASNVAFANATETNLWSDRRGRLARPAVASLPLVPPRVSAVLDAAMPARRSLEAAVTGRAVRPAASVRLARALSSLPAAAATVRRIVPARPGAARISPVVLIQDVHLNLEAQQNI